MPFFKTTHTILKAPWENEVFESNWMDSNKLILPPGGPDDPKAQWDYNREMNIDDVEIWEQLSYQGGGLGLYAAWLPYAEFYLVTHHLLLYRKDPFETFYGPMAMQRAYHRAKELGIPIEIKKIWVNDDDLWLYQQPKEKKIILS